MTNKNNELIFPIIQTNPYKPGSRRAKSFALLKKNGMSEQAYKKAGGNKRDLQQFFKDGHAGIGTSDPAPEKQEALPPEQEVRLVEARGKPPEQEATQGTEVVPVQEKHGASLLEEDAGVGSEGMTRDDFAIPRINILQELSPMCKKSSPEYDKDAVIGELLETVSRKRYDGNKGIHVVPVSYRRANIEWKNRNAGGGFIKDHGSDGSILNTIKPDEKGRYFTKNESQIVPTAEYFVYIVDKKTGLFFPVVISMASTQLKKARQWNTMISTLLIPRANGQGSFNPAMFARCYHLTTIMESKGENSWAGWRIVPDSMTLDLINGEDIYLAAKSFRETIQSGNIKVAEHEEIATVEDSEDPDSPM